MKRTVGFGVLVGCAVALFVSAPSSAAAMLLVDDFDRGEKPNALGGDYGSWDKDPSDPTQRCTIAFDKSNAFGNAGYSLRLDYDVDSPNPAYNGFWMKLQNTNLTTYKTVSFYIKGDAARGFTPQIKVEIKNGSEVGRYLLKGISDEWQKVSIPLKDFAGITEWNSMTEFVIVFDDITSTKKVGTIYIDEILFEG